jgi:hypothetical protein
MSEQRYISFKTIAYNNQSNFLDKKKDNQTR